MLPDHRKSHGTKPVHVTAFCSSCNSIRGGWTRISRTVHLKTVPETELKTRKATLCISSLYQKLNIRPWIKLENWQNETPWAIPFLRACALEELVTIEQQNDVLSEKQKARKKIGNASLALPWLDINSRGETRGTDAISVGQNNRGRDWWFSYGKTHLSEADARR